MEKFDIPNLNNFIYKFKTIDKEIAARVKCLLKGCQTFAKYSISLFSTEDLTAREKNSITKYICSKHLENWDSIKTNLNDEIKI